MRRPAPLPTPAVQDEKPAKARPPRRREEATPEDAERDVASTAEPESTDADDSGQFTARDVWRAARARRKTLRAEIRRFTQRSRRRRLIWIGIIGAVVVLVGGSAAAAYSPLFAVRKITVVGASALDPLAVESALSAQIGTPLALVDAGEVKAALVAFPLIETYALEARPPHDLTLRIVERTPIGVIESEAGFTLVDAAGVALSTTPTRPEGQPVIEVAGGIESTAFESVGLVVRSLPDEVRSAVVAVRATTLDDVTLTLGSGLTVVWGSADQSVEKARTLSTAMAVTPNARSIDVSSPDVVVAG